MLTLEFLRSFRLWEYSIFDLVISFLGVLVISPLLIRLFRLIHLEIPLSSWMLFTILIGILTHILTSNHTLMTKYFLDPSGHYSLKIFIVVITILGFAGVRFIK